MTDLPPGRELDLLIAQRVMGGAEMCGFRCPMCSSTHFGTWDGERHCNDEFHDGCKWHGSAEESPPSFSSDIEAAWPIVEKLRLGLIRDESGQWMAFWLDGRGGYIGETVVDVTLSEAACAPTAPHAICLVALEVVERA